MFFQLLRLCFWLQCQELDRQLVNIITKYLKNYLIQIIGKNLLQITISGNYNRQIRDSDLNTQERKGSKKLFYSLIYFGDKAGLEPSKYTRSASHL